MTKQTKKSQTKKRPVFKVEFDGDETAEITPSKIESALASAVLAKMGGK
jgi:hypothetical protein